jgi:hypothetical protein
MLVESLLELADNPKCQVILTTHVPNLAGLLPVDNLRFIKNSPLAKDVINVCDENTLEEISDQLGVLPDKRVQALFCVEGPHDIQFFMHISKILNAHDPTLPDLEFEKRIAILPVGGATLKQWVDNHYSRNLNIPEAHVYDRDDDTPPKYQQAIDTVNLRTDGSWGVLTTKREIENYIHPDAISEVFGEMITFTDIDDVPEILKIAINANPANPFKEIGHSRAKKSLNELAVKKMTKARLDHMDANNEIEGWMRQLSNMLS